MKGKFIVIEGGDGAGKDTQIELLKKDFPNFVYTRDPGGTELGSELRSILQYRQGLSKPAEMLIFLASRAQLVNEVVQPNLEKGLNVVCNRFEPSTFAYQIYGRERLELKEFVTQASRFARGECIPDLVVLLDVPPDVALKRVATRDEKPTRFEQEKIDFHNRVRQGYLESVKEFPKVEIIDASRSIEDVYKDVKAAVSAIL
ncbi:dTMP kinase [Candidatus Parcubacteria bacterium]|nr:dTMP kinase [Candidatus Parcubacteria bacterium]